jgi:uncharacterized cupredoxin-like copper-binding protein
MHTATLHMLPVLAAEKNRTVFYVFAGLLACWAVFVSLGLGLRKADFPSNLNGQRAVIAVSALLVAATMATGVITSGSPAKSAASAAPAETPPTTGAVASTSSSSLHVEANPSGQLAYNTKTLAAKAGKVTITMANMSPLPHNLTIAEGSKVLGATPTFRGGAKTLSLNLKPGTYTFYCSVPGHRQAGMEGTLTVS